MSKEERIARRTARREYRDSRIQQVLEMRRAGMTYAGIGNAMTPPVTRERVRQILNRHGGLELVGHKATTHKGKPKQQPKVCPHCDTVINRKSEACRKHWSREMGDGARAALREFIDTALRIRSEGKTWKQVGAAMGSTKQSEGGFQTKLLRRMEVARRHGVL